MSSTSNRKSNNVRCRYSTHQSENGRAAGFSVAKFQNNNNSMSEMWRKRNELLSSQERRAKENAYRSNSSVTQSSSSNSKSTSIGSRISSSNRSTSMTSGTSAISVRSTNNNLTSSRRSKSAPKDLNISVMSYNPAKESSIAISDSPFLNPPDLPKQLPGVSKKSNNKAPDEADKYSRSSTQEKYSTGKVVFSIGSLSSKAFVIIVAFAIVAIMALTIYPAAREYYISIRQLDAANAELTQVEDRNSQVQSMIDELSTDSGIEDYVRSQYGWVIDGEEAGVVSGLVDVEDSEDTTLPLAVESGSVQASDSLINDILDFIFMVDDDA